MLPVRFLMLNFAAANNGRKEMDRKNDYVVPRTTLFQMPDKPLLAVSAKPGDHVYDEGLDTDEGWTDFE